MNVKPVKDWIVVADFGQPPTSRSVSDGGIILPSVGDDSARYNLLQFRIGEVVSIGSGRVHKGRLIVPTDPVVGEVLLYSRKVGAHLQQTHDHPKYGKLYLRILDQDQVLAVMDDFEPWWNPGEAQIDPSTPYSN